MLHNGKFKVDFLWCAWMILEENRHSMHYIVRGFIIAYLFLERHWFKFSMPIPRELGKKLFVKIIIQVEGFIV